MSAAYPKKQLPPSTLLYREWLERVPAQVQSTIESIDLEALSKGAALIKAARRVFCVAAGSSVATAWQIAITLTGRAGISCSFIGLSQLITLESLNQSDLLILVSQGFNRADSAITMRTARARGAKIVVVTASKEIIHADCVIRFAPEADTERLFCRPCGAITSYATGALLTAACLNQKLDIDAVKQCLASAEARPWAEDANAKRLIEQLEQAALIVVLGSGELQPALHNVALSFREGAGKVAEFYEIEYYAHGQYAPHYKLHDSGAKVLYLLACAESDQISRRAVDRIMPLLKETKADYFLLNSQGRMPYVQMEILHAANCLVGSVIALSGYDMNTPRGKEENRGFQLVNDSYYE